MVQTVLRNQQRSAVVAVVWYSCLLLVVSIVSAAASSSSSSVSRNSHQQQQQQQQLHRFLENNNNNNQQQQQQGTVDGYKIQQGTCFRVRIDQGNDDDGNAYFYNGSYRSQYQRYMSFSFCDATTTTSSSKNSKNDKSTCKEYVTELETFLETAVDYIHSYCTSCATQCGGGRQRRNLQDGVWNVDCNSCSSECSLLNSSSNNNNENNNNNAAAAEGQLDESEYLDCQAAAGYENGGNNNNNDNIKYYTAPQCENGQVVIGHFYDNKCTIKTSTLQDAGFSYRTFRTIQATQMICAVNADSCYALFNDAVYCPGEDGKENDDEDDDDEASLCKAAKAAGRTYIYYKKPFYKKVPVVSIGFLMVLLSTAVSFLAYTYYMRHSRSKVIPMAQLDGDCGAGGDIAADTGGEVVKPTSLPPIS